MPEFHTQMRCEQPPTSDQQQELLDSLTRNLAATGYRVTGLPRFHWDRAMQVLRVDLTADAN